jgi:hypothetical protein
MLIKSVLKSVYVAYDSSIYLSIVRDAIVAVDVDANSRKNMLDCELGCHPCLAVRDCRTILHAVRVDSHRSPGGLHHQPYAGRSPTSPPRSRFPTTSSVRLLPGPGQSPFFSNPLTFIWTTGQDCSQPRGGETSDVGARSGREPSPAPAPPPPRRLGDCCLLTEAIWASRQRVSPPSPRLFRRASLDRASQRSRRPPPIPACCCCCGPHKSQGARRITTVSSASFCSGKFRPLSVRISELPGVPVRSKNIF